MSDEPLHFGYCNYIAVTGSLPQIGAGISLDLRYYYPAPSAREVRRPEELPKRPGH